MTPAAGRGGNPPSREHPINAGSASGRHPGPPAPDGAGDPSPRRLGQLASSRCPPLPAAGRCPQPPSPGHWPCASPEPCRPGGGTGCPSRRGGAARLSGGGGGGGLGGRARSCSTSEGCGLSGDEGRRGSPAAGGRRRGPPGHRLSPPPSRGATRGGSAAGKPLRQGPAGLSPFLPPSSPPSPLSGTCHGGRDALGCR